MEEEIRITRSQLETALRTWDEQAKAERWPDRNDENKHYDNATFLFNLLKQG